MNKNKRQESEPCFLLIKGSLLKFTPRKVDMVGGNVEDLACNGIVPALRKLWYLPL